jgi:hypothetical protein
MNSGDGDAATVQLLGDGDFVVAVAAVFGTYQRLSLMTVVVTGTHPAVG